jgi:hypothetical protein
VLMVGKTEGRRPLGRPICRWVNNIKTDLRDRGWGRVDQIEMVEGTYEHANEPGFHKMLGSSRAVT